MQMGMGRAGPRTTDPAIGHKQALVRLVREVCKGPGLLHVGSHRWARRRGQDTSKGGSVWVPEQRTHPTLTLVAQCVYFLCTFLMHLEMLDIAVEGYLKVSDLRHGLEWPGLTFGKREPLY